MRQKFHRRVEVDGKCDGRDGDGAMVWATAAATTKTKATSGSKGFRTHAFLLFATGSSPSISRSSSVFISRFGWILNAHGAPGFQSQDCRGLKPSPQGFLSSTRGCGGHFFAPYGEKKMTTTPPPAEENLIEPRRRGEGGQEDTRARTASWGFIRTTSNRYPHSLFQMVSPGPHSQEPRATETPCSKSNLAGNARPNDNIHRAL